MLITSFLFLFFLNELCSVLIMTETKEKQEKNYHFNILTL